MHADDHRAPDHDTPPVQDEHPADDRSGKGQQLVRYHDRPEAAEDIDLVRAARAALAWLYGPVTPVEAHLMATEGLVRTWTRVATDPRVTAERDVPAAHDRTGHNTWYPSTPRPGTRTGRRTGPPVVRVPDGLRVVIPEDPEWPATLHPSALTAPVHEQPSISQERYVPLCLWVRGPLRLSEALDRSVAVVGARAATEYGQYVAERLGVELAERRVSVVTTGGYGVDTAALRGALDADGVPVAVLPSSVDEVHPRGNAALFERVAEQGLVVSAWAPGRAAATRERLAANARLLAALSRGTVLVEAGHRRDSLTTLHHTLALSRPAMVVPGPVTSTAFTGNHQTLRAVAGTRVVTGADDIITDLSAD